MEETTTQTLRETQRRTGITLTPVGGEWNCSMAIGRSGHRSMGVPSILKLQKQFRGV